MMMGKHRGLPDPDSFIMDFTLSEFDKFTIINDYNNDTIPNNSNDDVNKVLVVGSIEITKKPSLADMTEMLKLANIEAAYTALNIDNDHDDLVDI